MTFHQMDTLSGEEDYDEQEAPNFFLETADPRDIATVSSELEDEFDAATEKYFKLKKERSKVLEYGPHDIWPIQYAIANTFMTTTGITSLFAKTGFGKTFCGIAIAEMCDVCLITVPNNLLEPWIKMFEKYGLYDVRNPDSSPVLVYSHKQPKSHYNYLFNASPAKLAGRETLVVLAPHNNIGEVMSRVFTSGAIDGREFTVIVDEIHKTIKELGSWIQPEVGRLVTRELLMSGSELTDKIIKANKIGTIDHTMHVHKTNEMPNENWLIKLMNSSSYLDDDVEWIDEVKARSKNSNRLVIVCEHDARDMLISEGIFGRKPIYKYAKQLNLMDKFSNEEKAVLFLTKLQTTGLNVNADTMIILNPGDASTEQLIQVSKRIVRHNNPSKEVYLHMLCGTPKEYYRVMYAKAFSLAEWPFGRQPVVNTSMVYKAIGAIRLLGLDHETLDRVDLCVFLADYAELELTGKLDRPFDQVLEWWNENKLKTTVLTPDIIRNIIFV